MPASGPDDFEGQTFYAWHLRDQAATQPPFQTKIGRRLGEGGAAAVHLIDPQAKPTNAVAKLFFSHVRDVLLTEDYIHRLAFYLQQRDALIGDAGLTFVAWPDKLILSTPTVTSTTLRQSLIGFTMDKVPEHNALEDFLKQPAYRSYRASPDGLNIIITIAHQLNRLHTHRFRFVLGDFNPNNVLISKDAKKSIWFIDADSFQCNYRDRVLSTKGIFPGFTSPEALANAQISDPSKRKPLTTHHDTFILAIYACLFLTDGHPFQTNAKFRLFPGDKRPPSMNDNIAARRFVLPNPTTFMPPGNGPENYAKLPQQLKDAFVQSFTTDQPLSANAWLDLLTKHRDGRLTSTPVSTSPTSTPSATKSTPFPSSSTHAPLTQAPWPSPSQTAQPNPPQPSQPQQPFPPFTPKQRPFPSPPPAPSASASQATSQAQSAPSPGPNPSAPSAAAGPNPPLPPLAALAQWFQKPIAMVTQSLQTNPQLRRIFLALISAPVLLLAAIVLYHSAETPRPPPTLPANTGSTPTPNPIGQPPPVLASAEAARASAPKTVTLAAVSIPPKEPAVELANFDLPTLPYGMPIGGALTPPPDLASAAAALASAPKAQTTAPITVTVPATQPEAVDPPKAPEPPPSLVWLETLQALEDQKHPIAKDSYEARARRALLGRALHKNVVATLNKYELQAIHDFIASAVAKQKPLHTPLSTRIRTYSGTLIIRVILSKVSPTCIAYIVSLSRNGMEENGAPYWGCPDMDPKSSTAKRLPGAASSPPVTVPEPKQAKRRPTQQEAKDRPEPKVAYVCHTSGWGLTWCGYEITNLDEINGTTETN